MSVFSIDDACLESLVDKALKAGAEAADALLVGSESLSVSMRHGALESLEQSEGSEIGLRVLIGKKQACVSSTDLSDEALSEAATRAVSMARLAPEDPYCGLADEDQIAKTLPEFEMADDTALEAPALIEKAKQAEDACLAVEGITQCESSTVGTGCSHVAMAASNGFSGKYQRTSYGGAVSAYAGEGTGMEQDYASSSSVFYEDMKAPEEIGKEAGVRAVSHLGPRKMPSCKAPVVFDPREGRSLLGEFASAISGTGVARGTSFLKDYMGKAVFGPKVQIIDDPLRPRGLRSKTFDAEGFLTSRREMVKDGVLQSWFLDLHTARQLGLESTGHAARGISGAPHPSSTNLYMKEGDLTREELIKDIKQGLYVTETMGNGVNGVTGDYSLAVRGFWIEDGKISFPVSEMTIAGNMIEMFKGLTPADDLVFLYGMNVPTIRIDEMTIAGL